MIYDDIIKTLECLSGSALKCRSCPYSPRYLFPLCQQQVAKDAITLITRQQAENRQLKKKYDLAVAEREANVKGFAEEIKKLQYEIERLKKENDQFADIGKMYNEIKSEARKEFAERLIAVSHPYADTQMVFELQIKNLLKEMESESNE